MLFRSDLPFSMDSGSLTKICPLLMFDRCDDLKLGDEGRRGRSWLSDVLA